MGMKEFIVKRIGQLIITFWAFITILFVVFRMMPGDPTTLYVTQAMTVEERQAMIEQLGLDQPLHIQYFDYIGQLLAGNLGQSYFYQADVAEILVTKFWNTIFLMGGAYFLAITGGVALGALLAWWRGSKFENVAIIVPFLIRSMPQFWIGILLILLFPFTLGIGPVGGFAPVGATFESFADRYLRWNFLYYVALPLLTGAIYYSAVPTLLMRNTMLEILSADFITMKEAAGLTQFEVLYKHAVRNSLLPITTQAAVVAGKSVGGAVLIEVVFNWPGMGRAMVDAVNANDYPLAMGAFFFMGATIMSMNFVADLLYAYLDPRVTYD